MQLTFGDIPVDRPVLRRFTITSRVASFLSGTGAYQSVNQGSQPHGESDTQLSLMGKLIDGRSSTRGTRVELDDDEAADLRGYVEAMEAGAADNTWDADGRADLAAARALLRQLNR